MTIEFTAWAVFKTPVGSWLGIILYYTTFYLISYTLFFFYESTRGIPFLTNQYWMTPHSSFPRPSCGSSKTRCALRAFFAVWGPRAASESLQDAAEWIHQGDGGLALFNSFRFVSCRDQTWWNMINLDVLSHIILDQTMNRYMIYIYMGYLIWVIYNAI